MLVLIKIVSSRKEFNYLHLIYVTLYSAVRFALDFVYVWFMQSMIDDAMEAN